MSDVAIQTFGMNKRLFNRVCPGKYRANVEGFGRIYISGLQQLVVELDAQIVVEKNRVKSAETRLKDKDEMIAMLKEQIAMMRTPVPSAPPSDQTGEH